MASGKLGNANLSATTNTTIYTVPNLMVSTMNINVVNRTSAAITIRLAISANASPVVAEYIEYDVSIPANGVLERTGLVAGAGENVVAYASASGISVRVHGFEEVA